MFSRLAAFTVLALPLFAVATPVNGARNDAAPTDACCTSTEPANSVAGLAILKGLGIDLSNLDVLLGLTCSPITVVGVGSGSACSSGTSVSCTNGVVNGIGIGCVPVTL